MVSRFIPEDGFSREKEMILFRAPLPIFDVSGTMNLEKMSDGTTFVRWTRSSAYLSRLLRWLMAKARIWELYRSYYQRSSNPDPNSSAEFRNECNATLEEILKKNEERMQIILKGCKEIATSSFFHHFWRGSVIYEVTWLNPHISSSLCS
jgi:hypothetical protein